MGNYPSREDGLPLTNGSLHDHEGENGHADRLRQHLSNRATAFFLTALVTIVASYTNTNPGKDKMAADSPPTPMDTFAFSVLGVVCSSAAAAALRPRFMIAADWLERLATLSAAVGFASLVSIILHARFRWVAYFISVAATLPLHGTPSWGTLRRLADIAHARFLGSASTQQVKEDEDAVV